MTTTHTHTVYPIEQHMDALLAAIPGARRGTGPGHGLPDHVEVPTLRPTVTVTVTDLSPWTEDEAGGSGTYVVATIRDLDGIIDVITETFLSCDPGDVATVAAEVTRQHADRVERQLVSAAIHDATPRDDVVAVEVATGRPFKRELRELIVSDPDVHPTNDRVDETVRAAVQRITGQAVPAGMNKDMARATLRRWGVLAKGDPR